MLKIKLLGLEYIDQNNLLKSHNLMPFRVRFFYRVSIFCFKILNRQILGRILRQIVFIENPLPNRLRNKEPELVMVPNGRTISGARRLTIFLPVLVNLLLRNTYTFAFTDFKKNILSNLFGKFETFIKHF